MVREAAVNQRPVRKLMKRGLESGEMRDPVPQTVGAEHKRPHCPMARELKDTENWKQKPKGHMAFQFLFHV